MAGRLTNEEYKFVCQRTPGLCVDLAVSNESELLLTFRSIPPFEKTWHFVGGPLMYKETMHYVMKRIAKQELGVNVIPGKFFYRLYGNS